MAKDKSISLEELSAKLADLCQYVYVVEEDNRCVEVFSTLESAQNYVAEKVHYLTKDVLVDCNYQRVKNERSIAFLSDNGLLYSYRIIEKEVKK